MEIELRVMDKMEFDKFYKSSFDHHVKELMEEEGMSQEEAEKETTEELTAMLPDGLDTKDNYLRSIRRKADDVTVGFIWTLHEYNEDVKQSFLCDFEIYDPYQRNGYATETLRVMETLAGNEGCRESVLFVANDNAAAVVLYEKCGYTFLKEMEYGRYLKKTIHSATDV